MGNLPRRPPLSSIFASKGFVVAFCAAIAMVLGAMSVGANSPAPTDPLGTPQPPLANQATAIHTVGSDKPIPVSSPALSTYLSHQQILVVKPVASANQRLTTTPAAVLTAKLNLKPLESSIIVPSQQLLADPALVPQAAPADTDEQSGDAPSEPLQGNTTTPAPADPVPEQQAEQKAEQQPVAEGPTE